MINYIERNYHNIIVVDMDMDMEKNEEDKTQEKPQEETKESHDTCLCDNCDELIVFEKHGFYILTKKDEELCWCQSCFEDHWKIMRDDLWECDDFEGDQGDDDADEEKDEEGPCQVVIKKEKEKID